EVNRLEIGRVVSGVARDLRPAFGDFFAQQLLQEADADVLQIRDLPFPLGIEAANVTDPAIGPQRHSERSDPVAEERHQVLFTVNVAVRIDVRRRPAQKMMEGVELPVEFVLDRGHVRRMDVASVFATDVKMQAYRQGRVVLAPSDRLVHGPAGDHETRTGDDTAGVAFEDAAVDSRRGAKVVSVDDEISVHVSSPSLIRTGASAGAHAALSPIRYAAPRPGPRPAVR